MLPLLFLESAQGNPMIVEVENGETFNGQLVNSDFAMNIHIREVICTSKDGNRFWKMPECYILGNTIKYIRFPDGVNHKVDEMKTRIDGKPLGIGNGKGRGKASGKFLKGIHRCKIIVLCVCLFFALKKKRNL